MKPVKNVWKKIVIYTSILSMLTLNSCLHIPSRLRYKSIHPNFISNIIPINDPAKEEKKDIDYSQLTWKEAIAYVKTPEQVQDYLYKHFKYDLEEYDCYNLFGIFNINTKGETFKYNHTRRRGICIDYATAAAALLSDDGYPSLLLNMRSEDSQHIVFLYRTNEGLGALGSTPEKPVHKTIDDIVRSISPKYEYYSIVNLDDNFKDREWIDGDIDLQVPNIDVWYEVKPITKPEKE